MKETRLLMGMPITLEVVDDWVTAKNLDDVFKYFEYIEEKFSVYKTTSEISMINRGEITLEQASEDMQTVFALAEETRRESDGYFNIARNDGSYDPSGLVKGWAIFNAAEILSQKGFDDFYVEAGGDIQAVGRNDKGEKWRVGIRNPFSMNEIVKVVGISNCGIATSGNYIRGEHIYDPLNNNRAPSDNILSITVIGPDIYEADRFATAAFAMGKNGILFIESLDGFEGYMIDQQGRATFTNNFEQYILHD